MTTTNIGDVTLYQGDCSVVLGELPDNSLDSCVTDPPYHLTSIVKRFGAENAAPAQFGKDGAFARASRGFMGKAWDGGDIAFQPEFWAEVYRVLKPGAHLVAFGASRGYHRMACAIEDAGFEIRDSLAWMYGCGFPKSHNVAIGIDKSLGLVKARGKNFNAAGIGKSNGGSELRSDHPDYKPYKPISDAARAFEGFGTALKPAFEPIVLARKPLSESTVAANVLRWGTGALNIDGCRVAATDNYTENAVTQGINTSQTSYELRRERRTFVLVGNGRWPANVVHDGSDEVWDLFPETKPEGSPARFFYSAKASKADRAGSKHPTVKPVALMQWLCRLITPPGGTVLDPFAGSGTTGQAATLEGFKSILIEREQEYINDIKNRLTAKPIPPATTHKPTYTTNAINLLNYAESANVA